MCVFNEKGHFPLWEMPFDYNLKNYSLIDYLA